ncbi:MAG: LPS-assembly protein LptD [Acidobacteria bacterium]|nr:MAG: LPS-assembly protein LptD [Acidobacteriota bacterium]
MCRSVWLAFALLLLGGFVRAQDRVTVEMPYHGGTIKITADKVTREAGDRWTAEGDVIVTFEDSVLKARKLTYEPATEKANAEGPIDLKRGVQWLQGSRAELDLKTDTGTIYDADGFTDQELFVKARVLIKTGPATYRAKDGFLTACGEDVPKWSFTIKDAKIPLGGNARFTHTLFRIKNLPVFYLPFMLFPTDKKERSSGFLLPTTGNSSNKGRRISESFYLVLGRSADLTISETYYSQRGFGHGVTFRTRPNAASTLDLDGFMINDRKDQGGASFNGLGETNFGNGYRAVADFNLVSNFLFRQVFSEDFYTATRPTENSRIFLTKNFPIGSANVLVSRDETVFPVRNIIIRSTPSLIFRTTGRQLFGRSLYLDLDASARGLSRTDPLVADTGTTQRMDVFPRAYVSIPLFQGLRATPLLGVRETFYTDSLVPTESGGLSVSRDGLHRNYVEMAVNLEGWGLSKVYRSKSGSGWKHTIEPTMRYRYLHGVDEFDQIIRFDENDTVVNTNEVEYNLFNRFFVKRKVDGGMTNHEWLSIRIGQKYFADPDFSGSFEADRINQFAPFTSLTGFHFGGIRRSFSPVITQVRFSPDGWTSFDVRGDYDPLFGQYRNFSLTGYLIRPGFTVGTSYFVTQKLEPGTFESNQFQTSVSVGSLQRGLSASTSFSYDAATSRFLSSLSRANYFWDCCGVSVEMQSFNLGVRQERQIRFSFFLKGIGAFGTIRRPPNVF